LGGSTDKLPVGKLILGEPVLQSHARSHTADRESFTTVSAPETCKLAMHLKVVALEDARFFWTSLGLDAPVAVFVPTTFAVAHAAAVFSSICC
jgi:hypothetical protein